MKSLIELKSRLSIAWHVLRGKPTIYKVRFAGGIMLPTDHQDVQIADCSFTCGEGEVWARYLFTNGDCEG